MSNERPHSNPNKIKMQNPDDYFTKEQKASMTQAKQVATLQPTLFTSWEPQPGWLFLLPSRLPEKTEGGIYRPESVTKKNNSGVCFIHGHIMGEKEDFYVGKECLFPQHTEYQVHDSDTGYDFYVLPADKVIMIRTPPPEILEFSRKKVTGYSFSEFQTEHPTQPK